jgi:hypothetical protein
MFVFQHGHHPFGDLKLTNVQFVYIKLIATKEFNIYRDDTETSMTGHIHRALSANRNHPPMSLVFCPAFEGSQYQSPPNL